jgi:hypothetical protein
VFLNPGRAPFGRDGFSAVFPSAHQQARIHCSSELEEVVVVGEVAYTRCRDSLSVTPIAGGEATRRSDAARRSSDHGLSQTARRPLTLGPRCPHVVPRGEAEVVSGSCSAIGNKGRSPPLIAECAGEPGAAPDRAAILVFPDTTHLQAARSGVFGRSSDDEMDFAGCCESTFEQSELMPRNRGY